MTTAPPALKMSTVPYKGAGERRHRRYQRRRLVRQQIAVVAIMVIALIITLLILGQQWLQGAGSVSSGAAALRSTSPATPLIHSQEVS
jgi:hypothetical protein